MQMRLHVQFLFYKISSHSYANKTSFHMKSFALSLAFAVRFKATRKWPIDRFSFGSIYHIRTTRVTGHRKAKGLGGEKVEPRFRKKQERWEIENFLQYFTNRFHVAVFLYPDNAQMVYSRRNF